MALMAISGACGQTRYGICGSGCDQEKNLPDCKKVLTSAGEFTAKAVIIAKPVSTKAWRARGNGWLAEVFPLCTCDGAFIEESDGSDRRRDVAVEDAIFLAGLCEKVYLILTAGTACVRQKSFLQEKLPCQAEAGLEHRYEIWRRS